VEQREKEMQGGRQTLKYEHTIQYSPYLSARLSQTPFAYVLVQTPKKPCQQLSVSATPASGSHNVSNQPAFSGTPSATYGSTSIRAVAFAFAGLQGREAGTWIVRQGQRLTAPSSRGESRSRFIRFRQAAASKNCSRGDVRRGFVWCLTIGRALFVTEVPPRCTSP